MRNATFLVLFGVLVALAAPALAQAAPEVSAEVGLDGYIDPYQAIPVRVELTSPVLWVGSLTAELGSQSVTTEIEVPAGGVKVYNLTLPAPGSNLNRQLRLRFTPNGADQPVATENVQVRFATNNELVASIGAPGLSDTLDQVRTVAVGSDVAVAEISEVNAAISAASYLVAGRGGLDGLSSAELSMLESWLLDGGRLVGMAADLARVGVPDGPAVAVGSSLVAPYGSGELIDVDPNSLSVDEWSQVLRPTPGLFVAQNFGNPAGFDLFQAATGDNSAGTPQIPWLLGGLVAYALLVGPMNFLVLRAIGRRELVWLTIPALSAVAVFAFWLFGPRTAIAQVTHASAIVLEGEEGTARSGLVMVAGQEGEHTLGVPEGWTAAPAGDLRQMFGPGVLSGSNLVASSERELTFDTDSLEAVPVTASHPITITGLDVAVTAAGRQISIEIGNQTDTNFWFWGVGIGLTAVAGDGELESGQTVSRTVAPGRQQDPWQAPMATAYWNRQTGFFDDGNEVWQIIEPLAREANRADRRIFQQDAYFFGYTDDIEYDITVDGRAVPSRGPALVLVPVDLTTADQYAMGQISAELLGTTGQEFVEEGFTPFIVGADEVFVRFQPPAGVTEASVRVSNPFGGPGNQSDISVFHWEQGVFVNVLDVAGNLVERWAIDDYLDPMGDMIVKLDPRDFGEIFPSSIALEWTP